MYLAITIIIIIQHIDTLAYKNNFSIYYSYPTFMGLNLWIFPCITTTKLRQCLQRITRILLAAPRDRPPMQS